MHIADKTFQMEGEGAAMDIHADSFVVDGCVSPRRHCAVVGDAITPGSPGTLLPPPEEKACRVVSISVGADLPLH